MRNIKLELSKLGTNQDPNDVFFDEYVSKFTELDLNKTNSYVSLVKGSYDIHRPYRTLVQITKIESEETFDFYVDRISVNSLLKGYNVDETQLIVLLNDYSSVNLLEILAEHLNTTFQPEDFWVEYNSLKECGGESGPNFLLEATFDNLWFTDKTIIGLKES